MLREIVVFERDERASGNGTPELNFRLINQALPNGSCPLAIVTTDSMTISGGQWFTRDEVEIYAKQQSGMYGIGDKEI